MATQYMVLSFWVMESHIFVCKKNAKSFILEHCGEVLKITAHLQNLSEIFKLAKSIRKLCKLLLWELENLPMTLFKWRTMNETLRFLECDTAT